MNFHQNCDVKREIKDGKRETSARASLLSNCWNFRLFQEDSSLFFARYWKVYLAVIYK